MMRGYEPQRDGGQLGCYDADGKARFCVLDSDHGAIRVAVTGKGDQFFELRADQVGKFQVVFDSAIDMTMGGAAGDDFQRQGMLQCYSKAGELRICLIEACHGALRITCTEALTPRQDCFLELRGEQVGEFRIAFDAAVKVSQEDTAIHSEIWADDAKEDDTEGLSPLGNDAQFTAEINTMITDEAPSVFALVEEVGDRVDAAIIAWGMAFPDHAEIMSAGRHGVRGVFRSAERARKLLSANDKIKVRLVWVTTAQDQVKLA
jgi:hypothetical protein